MRSGNNAGVEFFVEEEPERAVVLVSARGNLAPTEVRDLTVEVEQRLMTVPGVKHVITTAGTAPGGAQLGDVEDKPVDTVGQITIELTRLLLPPPGEGHLRRHPRAGRRDPRHQDRDQRRAGRPAHRQGSAP
jgi:multidrug efflux pump subunit AcrB